MNDILQDVLDAIAQAHAFIEAARRYQSAHFIDGGQL